MYQGWVCGPLDHFESLILVPSVVNLGQEPPLCQDVSPGQHGKSQQFGEEVSCVSECYRALGWLGAAQPWDLPGSP